MPRYYPKKKGKDVNYQTPEEIRIWGRQAEPGVTADEVPSFDGTPSEEISKYWQGIAKEIAERIDESTRITDKDLSIIINAR